ncbi:alpha-1,2-fucosyltransferase [Treponema sp. TIM-1]|uniref:alpha-1,2-fucosyltransferase n=1 Tax=Treponema sp. TIM-1 TaxID=2898417 RepID=UPI0039813325
MKINMPSVIKTIYRTILPYPLRNSIVKSKRFFLVNISKSKSYLSYFFSNEIRKNPEIITIIDGGLGSQMGQYVMGQEIRRITGREVSYDLSWYEHGGKDINGKENRLYELENVFPNIVVRKAGIKKRMLYKKLFNKYDSNLTINNLDEIDFSRLPIYLGGYWKTNKYSNYDIDSLRRIFAFSLRLDDKNKELLNKINSCSCSVAIQIRMGDYLGSVLDVINQKYFYNAINYLIKEKKLVDFHFFVFSDDIEKSKQMLSKLPYHFVYVTINDNDHGAYDMFLMSQCHHFIISNSSFGFWPALLSVRTNEKMVIQPNKWLKTDTEKVKSKYPGWIFLDC